MSDSLSSTKRIQLYITSELSGTRLDRALATLPEIHSRTRAARLIELGLVFLEGKPVKASQKAKEGDLFSIEMPPVESSTLAPYDFPLEILFEDDDLIVLNKPAGLVVHPAAGHPADTLVNALMHHTKNLSMGFSENRPGIVHRLDKDTSGVLVVAKNDRAQEAIASQFKARTTHRIYWAIVFGKPKLSEGKIVSTLRRHPTDRKRFASERILPNQIAKGKRAVTHYQVLNTHFEMLSLVKCQLETGRTHQIRIHMSELGHPLIGDSLYGGLGRQKMIKSTPLRKLVENLHRLGLHAAELGFKHPRTSESMMFKAPWPTDLLPIVEWLEWN